MLFLSASGLLEWITAKLLDSVNHRQDILRRNVVHDGVHSGGYESTPRRQILNHTSYFFPDLLRRTMREDRVRVNSPTKDNLATVAFL